MSSKVERPSSLALSQPSGSLTLHTDRNLPTQIQQVNNNHSAASDLERHVHFAKNQQPNSRNSGIWNGRYTNGNSGPSAASRRKRSNSCSWSVLTGSDHHGGNGAVGGGGRYRRRRIGGGLQQNFLMGGSITDPLNLTALEPSEYENRPNAVPVVIPLNINDPLNLGASSDSDDECTTPQLLSNLAGPPLGHLPPQTADATRRRRKQKRRKRRYSEPGGNKEPEQEGVSGGEGGAGLVADLTISADDDAAEMDGSTSDMRTKDPSRQPLDGSLAPILASCAAGNPNSDVPFNFDAVCGRPSIEGRWSPLRNSAHHHQLLSQQLYHNRPPRILKSIGTSAIEGKVSRLDSTADASTEDESFHGDSLEDTCNELDRSPCKLVVVEKELPEDLSLADDSDASTGKTRSTPVLKSLESVPARLSSPCSVPSTSAGPNTPSTPLGRTPSKRRSWDNSSHSKIVSPVVPLAGPSKQQPRGPAHTKGTSAAPSAAASESGPRVDKKPPKFNPKGTVFQYGNYYQYYGYRNPNNGTDIRLSFLNPRWFDGREVLDIGCNAGHVTLSVAKVFRPRFMTGIDIDPKLVALANKNLRQELNIVRQGDRRRTCDASADYPKSFARIYQDIPIQTEMNDQLRLSKLKPKERLEKRIKKIYPYNVKFVKANYVPESDELLEMVRPQYDVIMCLSVTKWVHLNWGDDGLKRFFKRIFLNLKPGGRLILEPQPWNSYGKKKKLTPTILSNYRSIQLRPEMFEEYLLRQVGFAEYFLLTDPGRPSRGFHRPLQMYIKEGDPNGELQEPESPLADRPYTSRHDGAHYDSWRAPGYLPTNRDLGFRSVAYRNDVPSGHMSDYQHPYQRNYPTFTMGYRRTQTPLWNTVQHCSPSPYPSPHPYDPYVPSLRVAAANSSSSPFVNPSPENSQMISSPNPPSSSPAQFRTAPRKYFSENSPDYGAPIALSCAGQSSPNDEPSSPCYAAPSSPNYAGPSSPNYAPSGSPTYAALSSPNHYSPSSPHPGGENYIPSPKYSVSSPRYSPCYSRSSPARRWEPSSRFNPTYQPSASPRSIASPHPSCSPQPSGTSPSVSPAASLSPNLSPHPFVSPHPNNDSSSNFSSPRPPNESPSPFASPHTSASPQPSASSPYMSASPQPAASSPYPSTSPFYSSFLQPSASSHYAVSPHQSASPRPSTSASQTSSVARPPPSTQPSASPQSSASPRPAASPYPSSVSPLQSSPHLYCAMPFSSVSPHPSSASPHPSSASPHPSSISPHPSSNSPHPSSISPHPSSISPHPSSISPHPSSISPHPSSASPHPSSASPHPYAASPHPYYASPYPLVSPQSSPHVNISTSPSTISSSNLCCSPPAPGSSPLYSSIMCPPSLPPAHRNSLNPRTGGGAATAARTNQNSNVLGRGGSEPAFEPCSRPSSEGGSGHLYSPDHDSVEETAETSPASGSESYVFSVSREAISHNEAAYASPTPEQSGSNPDAVCTEPYSAEKDASFVPALYSTSNTNSSVGSTLYRVPASDVERGMDSASHHRLETCTTSSLTSFSVSASETAPVDSFDSALGLERSIASVGQNASSVSGEEDNALAKVNSEIHTLPIVDPIPCPGTFSVTKITTPMDSFSEAYSDVFDVGIHSRVSNTVNAAMEASLNASGSRLNVLIPGASCRSVQNSFNTSKSRNDAVNDERPLTTDLPVADNSVSDHLLVREEHVTQQPVEDGQDSLVADTDVAYDHLVDPGAAVTEERCPSVRLDHESQNAASAVVPGESSVLGVDGSSTAAHGSVPDDAATDNEQGGPMHDGQNPINYDLTEN